MGVMSAAAFTALAACQRIAGALQVGGDVPLAARWGRGFMGSRRGFVSVCEEGVLELELTAEEVRAIAQPREARPRVAVRPVLSVPAREASSPAPKSGS